MRMLVYVCVCVCENWTYNFMWNPLLMVHCIPHWPMEFFFGLHSRRQFRFLLELRWHLHTYKRHNKYVWLYSWRITFSGHDTDNWFEDALLASKSKQSHQYRIESAALKVYEHIEFNGWPVINKLIMRIRQSEKKVSVFSARVASWWCMRPEMS